MNCAECRENLVACLEELLPEESSRQCRTHLDTCDSCRAEYAALSRLQERLATSGRKATEVSLVIPVMRRVRALETEQEGSSLMKLFRRWGWGLGAAAGMAALIIVAMMAPSGVEAKATDVLAKGARAMAKLKTVHIRGQLRTPPADNFSAIIPAADLTNIELWKQFEPDLKWRVEKPGRVALMDGQSTLLYLKPANLAMKIPQPARSAFDTDWIHGIADLSGTITKELQNARAKGWPLKLAEERTADGRTIAVVTIETKSGLPDGDYLKDKFVQTADTRRVYRFDTQTERLESAEVYLLKDANMVPIFLLSQIEYDLPIDPGVFHLDLPANVNWYQEPQVLPDNQRYASMTAEQAARAFFEACGRSDWTEVGRFFPIPLNEQIQQYVAGLQIVSLGESFTSQGNEARFVPYEIKLKSGETKKHNLALKRDRKTNRWFVDGGF
ncbi:MAG TPA: zf-HC2 domain-containing protein [Candidatus Limnocylindrales bacterium]|nr:zf-HC2 domain-containing protein [Candidatus Limnocylindrales bacterium]